MENAFFIASKLVWALIKPTTWLALAMGAAVIAGMRGRARAAAFFSGTGLSILLSIAVLPIGDLLLLPLENRYPSRPVLDRIDGIIVLGGAESAILTAARGQPSLNAAGERFSEAVRLARDWPQARLAFTGGAARLIPIEGIALREADVAAQFFAEQGIAPERITLEREARNTAENASLSLALVKPQPGETWVLVTSAWHMPRSARTFQRAGWEVVPWPVDYRAEVPLHLDWSLTRNLPLLTTAIKEYVGLAAYWASGR